MWNSYKCDQFLWKHNLLESLWCSSWRIRRYMLLQNYLFSQRSRRAFGYYDVPVKSNCYFAPGAPPLKKSHAISPATYRQCTDEERSTTKDLRDGKCCCQLSSYHDMKKFILSVDVRNVRAELKLLLNGFEGTIKAIGCSSHFHNVTRLDFDITYCTFYVAVCPRLPWRP